VKELKKYLAAAKAAAKLAGGIQMEAVNRRHQVKFKGVSNLVTEVDVACEKAIIASIHAKFPDHSFLAEEGGESKPGSPYLWIIDPLDGTTNYAHGFRRFCVSIALTASGEPQVGVVYNPIARELFSAVRGQGAWLNGKPIAVSRTKRVEDALICTGFSYDKGKRLDRDLKLYIKVLRDAQSMRRSGCAALDLCDVACGRFDGFWELNLNAWDIAAGCLLITEAGGQWTGIKGKPVDIHAKEFLGTNGTIHQAMVKIING
jgi:myo-inositol-1(or 4)-monophosphatase